jgi:hypothetical protein
VAWWTRALRGLPQMPETCPFGAIREEQGRDGAVPPWWWRRSARAAACAA